MTRWNILKDLVMSYELRHKIGKSWPLFFFVVYNSNKSNKCITSYSELTEQLGENQHTIKQWRDHLAENKVVEVKNGRSSMTIILLSPYDGIVTCEQDDIAQVKMKSDPATKKIIDQLSGYNNMSLLPMIAELSSKIDRIEKGLT